MNSLNEYLNVKLNIFINISSSIFPYFNLDLLQHFEKLCCSLLFPRAYKRCMCEINSIEYFLYIHKTFSFSSNLFTFKVLKSILFSKDFIKHFI